MKKLWLLLAIAVVAIVILLVIVVPLQSLHARGVDWPAAIGTTTGRIAALAGIVWLMNYFIKLHRGE